MYFVLSSIYRRILRIAVSPSAHESIRAMSQMFHADMGALIRELGAMINIIDWGAILVKCRLH